MKNSYVSMHQVHGNNYKIVGKKDMGTIVPDCDALITSQKGVTLAVYTADCLPILIKDTRQNVIAAVHAGWRGLENQIIEKVIKVMVGRYKTNPSDIIVGIGPHICEKHYEVKSDVSKYFSEAKLVRGKIHLDLSEVCKNQLLRLGVSDKNIKVSESCTFEDSKLPSYRRSPNSGRIVSTISLA